MEPIAYRLVSKQLALLERSIRSIRAGIDKIIAENQLDGKQIEVEVEVNNGLSQLLSSSKDIRPTRVEPYQKFVSGICVGHSVKRGNFAVIETATLSTPSNVPYHKGACCLIFHPTFNQDEPAEWMTLEVDVDIEQIKKVDSLIINLLPMFFVNNGIDLSNFALQMRVYYGSDVKDFAYYKYPSLTYPIELTYSLESSVISEMKLAHATHALILIHLPVDTRCDYRFIISHFSAVGKVIG